jgi:hypothetical protein
MKLYGTDLDLDVDFSEFMSKKLLELKKEAFNFLVPRLEKLKESEEATPEETDYQKWQDILDTMILGFSSYKTEDVVPEETRIALELLSNYFNKLWS